MTRYSIIQDFRFKECYICHTRQNLHIHEVFYGTSHRKISIEDGLCVCLCGKHHNLSSEGVHSNIELDKRLKKEAQLKWQEHYKKTEEEFIKRYRRSYL